MNSINPYDVKFEHTYLKLIKKYLEMQLSAFRIYVYNGGMIGRYLDIRLIVNWCRCSSDQSIIREIFPSCWMLNIGLFRHIKLSK